MSTNSRKGKLLEQIAASLYSRPGLDVKTRQPMPPQSGRGRPREVDVLVRVDSQFGNKILFAIECKNETKPIEATYIDAFFGMLTYIGIPPGNGIFVSRSSFTRGAKERATEAGIRLYKLTGMRDDGVASLLFEALQSVVYLLADIYSFALNTNSADSCSPVFFDKDGSYVGTLYDLGFVAWSNGLIPLEIGEHEVELKVPSGWLNFPKGPSNPSKVTPIISATIKARVLALVYTVVGRATRHSLTDASTNLVEKESINAWWKETPEAVTIRTFRDQGDVDAYLANSSRILAVAIQSVPLPRVQVATGAGQMFWPPTQISIQTLFDRIMKDGDVATRKPHLDGAYFNRIFDDVWDQYPLASMLACDLQIGSEASDT
jgi:hypothetical protein